MSSDQIVIFDTTLRDGEQSPGCSMNTAEKLEVARALVELNVDVIEAGFPIASPGDFEAVQLVARECGDRATVAGLARCVDAGALAGAAGVDQLGRHAQVPRERVPASPRPARRNSRLPPRVRDSRDEPRLER